MKGNYTCSHKGHELEYFDKEHIYILDGVLVPSISTIAGAMNPNYYAGISKEVLDAAAAKGTAVHEAIENYCLMGEESNLPELRNFKFLMKHIGFEVLNNEVPVFYFNGDEPIMAGRLDLVISKDNVMGLADIKRTSGVNKNGLAYQLNLYRIAYQQTYNKEICFLAGLHLHEDTRKYIEIPINEEAAYEAISNYERNYK